MFLLHSFYIYYNTEKIKSQIFPWLRRLVKIGM
nr:MAG TPA: hypothetical protein [Caudoviricetes sp.]